MMKIVVVQSRSSEKAIEREQANFRRVIGKSVDVEFLSALDERLAWTYPDKFLSGCSGVIFGGSADYDLHGGRTDSDPFRVMATMILSRTRLIVSYALAQHIPVLGICFGHQTIAQMRGGNVTADEAQKKSGTFGVELTEEGMRDPLFAGFPRSFAAQYGHKDSVTALPEGATLLASSAGCRFSMLRYGDRTYTMQFHPELTAADQIYALKNAPEYLPKNVSAEAIVRESPETLRIIPLWIKRIVAKRTVGTLAPKLLDSLIGFENEAWVIRKEGDDILPGDISDALEALNENATGGSFGREPGLGSIEFIGDPESTVGAAARNIRALYERAVSAGLSIECRARSPYTAPVPATVEPGIQKDRPLKLWAAAREEVHRLGRPRSDWERVKWSNHFAALHMHISFPEFEISKHQVHPRMLFVMNMMNYVGPRVARILCKKYGIDNTGHLAINAAWADERRFPAFGRWFPTFRHFKWFFESLKRLITLTEGDKEHGKYAIDLRTHLTWGMPGEMGAGMWTFCRLRPVLGTLEIRILPSWPVDTIADVGADLYEFVELLVSETPEKPLRSLEELVQLPAWEKITSFKIGGFDCIPNVYTQRMWQSDVDH